MLENITVIFTAKCMVVDTATYPRTHPIMEGLRANLYVNRKFCPSIVSLCNDSIDPGNEGTIKIRAIALKENSGDFRRGSPFELREGPENILARCEIVSQVEIEN